MIYKITLRVATLAITIATATVLAAILIASVGRVSAWQYNRQAPSSVFEYFAVEYNGPDDEGALWMTSVSIWHEAIEKVVWLDQLRCEAHPGQGDFGVYSTATSDGGDFGPTPIRRSPWHYQAGHPRGGTCFMRSTITVQNRGAFFQQTIDSETFQTPTQET